MGVLTVAYGSNVDPAQMAHRCPGARVVEEIELPGLRPSFGGPSRLRGGGVATLVSGEGSVRAVVWDVPSLDELDRLEGHPHFYERHRWPQGHIYLLRSEVTPLAPSAAYLDQVLRAHRGRGWDTSAWEEAAQGLPAALIFVYGSLRRGGRWHHVLGNSPFAGRARTRREWSIVPVGPYPGLVPGSESVEGELFLVSAEVLAAVDRLEEHPHLYRRTVLWLEDGRPCEAYRFNTASTPSHE